MNPLILVLSVVLGSTHPCHSFLDADLDRSGRVDVSDLIDVLMCYGQEPCDSGDVNRDNVVNVLDLLGVLGQFGQNEAAACDWIDIHTIEQLADINDNSAPFGLDLNYRITCDMNFGPSWCPIAMGNERFQGTLIAVEGVTLNNLRVDHSNTGHPDHDEGAGLFAWLGNAYIRDLHFVNADVRGGEHNGTLAGHAVNGGHIENVTSVNAYIEGDRYIGGIAGEVVATTIIDSHFQGELSAQYGAAYFTGGIAGHVWWHTSVVSRCSADVQMFVGWTNQGGLIGRLDHGCLRRSHANVEIGTEEIPLFNGIGGLVGGAYDCHILDCYVTGDISVGWLGLDNVKTGGAVGFAYSGAEMHRVWTDVTVHYFPQGPYRPDGHIEEIGTVVGRRAGTWGPWTRVIFDESCEWPPAGDNGGYDDGMYGHTAAEMYQYATYGAIAGEPEGFDFDRCWIMQEGEYPTLR